MRIDYDAYREFLYLIVHSALRDDYMNTGRFASIKRHLHQKRARRAGHKFWCKALWEPTRANQCPVILSDGTLVRSCIDYNAEAPLGSLPGKSLVDVWRGPAAANIRNMLLNGLLPLQKCAYCWNLVEVEEAHEISELDVKDPSTVLLENTSLCNYSCAGCPIDGVNKSRKGVALSMEDSVSIYRHIRDAGVRQVGCYNYGDPFMDKAFAGKLYRLREILGDDAVLFTSSNGALIDTPQKMKSIVECINLIGFSIHGSDGDSMRKYQRNGDFHAAYENMKGLARMRAATVGSRLSIEWRHLLFRWNSRPEMCAKAARLAREADVDMLCFSPTRSPAYGISIKSLLAWQRGEDLHGVYKYSSQCGFEGYKKPGYVKFQLPGSYIPK